MMLPKLTALEDFGGDGWQSLMTQILLAYARDHGFVYRPGPTPGKDGGVDGSAPEGGVPAMKGPVVFQAKWLSGEIQKGTKKTQIEESLATVAREQPEVRHWVLVTPHDLTQAQQKWLFGLKPRKNLKIHHWGHAQITGLMRQLCPELFRRYYPLIAEDDSAHETAAARLAPYLGHLIGLCRFVPLRGVSPEDRRDKGDPQRHPEDPNGRLELERIFVDLDTTTQIRVAGADGAPRPGKEAIMPPDLEREKDTRYLPALEAAGAVGARHVVLHGAPGCGKSTFVRFLVLALAHCGAGRAKDWQPRLAGWPAGECALLPARIELRHFDGWLRAQKIITPEPCHLWNYWIHELQVLQAKEVWEDVVPAVEEAARAGRVLFLLDGLDEVPGGKGKLFVRDCIEKFAGGQIGKHCRIMVTCRTRSYDADYGRRKLHLFEAGHGAVKPAAESEAAAAEGKCAAAYELRPFDEPKKKRFIEAWYKALVEIGQVKKAAADTRIKALQEAVCDPKNPKLGELAQNPLLLTVIAHLHSSQKDLKLPDNRAELFDNLIDLLLSRWAERHQPTGDAKAGGAVGETLGELLADPGVDGFKLVHLRQLVAELAHDHYRGGKAQSLILIPAETLRDRLKEQHHGPDAPEGAAWAERVMEFIQYRAGLLNSPDGGVNYDFPHSLLGEYLAAYHLARERRSSEVVAGKVTPDGNWDEVVRLVAGHHVFVRNETRDALDLVEELCGSVKDKTDDAVTELMWRRVALAGDIVSEIGPQRLDRERRQGPRCRDEVRELLKRLVGRGALPPRDRARAGIALGRLGDDRKGVGLLLNSGVPDIDWIEIPPGPFKMGSNKGETPVEQETPQFDCELITRPYEISRYPVTVAQYQAFVDAGGYNEKGFWTQAGWEWKESASIARPAENDAVFQTPNHPRVGVSWYESLAFCRWLSEVLKRNVTLPSEPEWERAARHVDGRKFPWGAEEKGIEDRCNLLDTGLGHTSAVGMFPTGLPQCGAADMAGNVWEWTRSFWGKGGNLEFRYPYRPEDGRENPDAPGNATRVLRGGSWYGSAVGARCAYRRRYYQDLRYRHIGFRLVASPFPL